MRTVSLAIPLIAALATTSPALAEKCGIDIQARFIESAPRDSFVIENKSSGQTEIASLALDLRSSSGRLIFDTENGGEGVEVFQLYRAEDGDAIVQTPPTVKDGDDQLALAFTSFGAGQTYRFSIDVDDRLASSELGQIRVSGSEIEGASVQVFLDDGSSHRAVFGADNRAHLTASCF